jgi:hypothetical protein
MPKADCLCCVSSIWTRSPSPMRWSKSTSNKCACAKRKPIESSATALNCNAIR